MVLVQREKERREQECISENQRPRSYVRGSFFRKHGESYCLEYERQNKLSLSLSSNKDRCVQALLLLTCHDTFLVQINFNQKTPIVKHISDL